MSPRAKEVIKYTNLAMLGFDVSLDELPPDIVNAIEYYGIRKRAKEEEERFKVLGQMLSKLFKK